MCIVYLQFTYYILVGTHNVGRLANGRHDFVYGRNTLKSSSYLFLFNRALSVSRSLTPKSWYMTYSTTHINIYIYYMYYVCIIMLCITTKNLVLQQQPHQFNTPSCTLWSEDTAMVISFFSNHGWLLLNKET